MKKTVNFFTSIILALSIGSPSMALAPQCQINGNMHQLKQLEAPGESVFEGGSKNLEGFIEHLKRIKDRIGEKDSIDEAELFDIIKRNIRKFPSGDYYSLQQFMTNQAFQCVGCTAIAGYIFRELGYQVYWLNVIDNIDLAPEGHASLLVRRNSDNQHVIFDAAMNLEDYVPVEENENMDSAARTALSAGERLTAPLLVRSTPKEQWAKALMEAGETQDKRSYFKGLHPTFQIMDFDQGYLFAQKVHEAEKIYQQIKPEGMPKRILEKGIVNAFKLVSDALKLNPSDPYATALYTDILCKFFLLPRPERKQINESEKLSLPESLTFSDFYVKSMAAINNVLIEFPFNIHLLSRQGDINFLHKVQGNLQKAVECYEFIYFMIHNSNLTNAMLWIFNLANYYDKQSNKSSAALVIGELVYSIFDKFNSTSYWNQESYEIADRLEILAKQLNIPLFSSVVELFKRLSGFLTEEHKEKIKQYHEQGKSYYLSEKFIPKEISEYKNSYFRSFKESA